MAWQDDLRELDNALAEGRISADDYRRRRDTILAGPAAPQQPAAGQQAPFAPPFRWQAEPPTQQAAPPSADATQVVQTNQPPVNQPQPNPEATQVVTGGGQRNPDSERTQFVQPVAPPNQGGWQSGPQNQQIGAPPPWTTGGDGFSMGDASPGWIAQGPEVFDDKPSSGAGKKILIVLVVMLLLGGIGTGVYFLVNRQGGGGGETQAQSTSQTPTTTSKPKPTEPLEILLEQLPEPGGKKDLKIEVAATARLVELKMLDQGEADLLTALKITKVPFKSGQKEPDQFGPTPDAFSVMVFPTNSEAEAETLVAQLKAYQEANGLVFIKEPLPKMPLSVIFEKKVDNDAALYRGLWASGKNVVRVNVDQIPMTGEASLSGSYQRQVQAALKSFPAP
ncbi:hypothetical protein GCM10022267_02600 [Lentzea roselyniae]|uniref:Flagellar basal body-associated protein FliL n=1 Tax=Lentzea roselyniae TaxID=531940 RepID=A0ABP6ZY41_9PSEU